MSADRIADYFLIVGLPENPVPLEISGETPAPKPEPITDICVIIPRAGEECPPGYKPLLHTPTGLNADLNSGSIRSDEVILCYRRGRDKPPLQDIGILYVGKEKVLQGCEIIDTTPYGRPANLNNGSNQVIHLTYRRAEPTASSDTLAVTNIQIIITNKGEQTPHSYNKIDKNLNKGVMGNNVYLCYKKSTCKDYSLTYKPAILSRYPMWDWRDFPLQGEVAGFALPMGAVLESWLVNADHPQPVLSTFVLTGENANKMYGAAVLFYETYPEDKLSEEQKRDLNLHAKIKKRRTYVTKAICLLARKPFFDGFSKFLRYLYRMTIRKGSHDVSIEHHIDHLMWQVPQPTATRPSVRLDIVDGTECYFNLLDHNPIPLSGASFIQLLRNLELDTALNLLTYVLLENKLVIHSLRPSVLTKVCEAVSSMIFPFQWQCPYIPMCPLTLADILSAPCPFIIGVDSRYFDLFTPPHDVLCIDLDTNSIHAPPDKLNLHKLLPKRPLKVLRATLTKLYLRIGEHEVEQRRAVRPETAAAREVDKTEQQVIEIAIQEAFLRFMASILKGYRTYLLPLTGAPTLESTDIKERFDMPGFLKSRDKAYHKLYLEMLRTQAFSHFIGERSFNMRGDASLDFFDECADKVDENVDTPPLLECDGPEPNTLFIPPLVASQLSKGETKQTYSYSKFPNFLNMELFPHIAPPSSPVKGSSLHLDLRSFIAKRTRADIRNSLKNAQQSKQGIAASALWAKCLLSNAMSLWFSHLHSFTKYSGSPRLALRSSLIVLKKIHDYKLPVTEDMPFSVIIQLSGIYEMPAIAVKVMLEMKRTGHVATAATYGFYNKVVLESSWATHLSDAKLRWRKIRHLIVGVSQFRQPLRQRCASQQSLTSGVSADIDSISRGSADSLPNDGRESEDVRKDDRISNGTASDRGYASLSRSQEDVQAKDVVTRRTQRSHNPPNRLILSPESTQHSDEFRSRVGSIIRKSPRTPFIRGGHTASLHQQESTNKLRSSAGLLMSTSKIKLHHESVLLSASFHGALWNAELTETIKKRHKSAGDNLLTEDELLEVDEDILKKSKNVEDNPTLRQPTLTDTSLTTENLQFTPKTNDPSLATPGSKSIQNPVERSRLSSNITLIDVTDSAPKQGELLDLLDAIQPKTDAQAKTPVNSDPLGDLGDEFDPLASLDPLGALSPKHTTTISPSNSLKSSIKVTSDDPLGVFTDPTPLSNGLVSDEVFCINNTTPPPRSMDIGSLFGRDTSPKKSLSRSTDELEGKAVKKYHLLELSPEQENGPTSPTLRKSVSLDSRSSYQAAIKQSDQINSTASKSAEPRPTNGPAPLASIAPPVEATPPPVQATPPKRSNSYTSWIKSSLKKTTSMAASSAKVLVNSYTRTPSNINSEPAGSMSSRESLDSIGGVQRKDKNMRGSMKKIKSMSSNMASKLYHNYNKLVHTVQEYQAPSTVSQPYKEYDSHSVNEDAVSVNSSNDCAALAEEQQDDGHTIDTSIKYRDIPSSFTSQYLYKPSGQMPDQVDNTKKTSQGDKIEVVLCSASRCSQCASILYDEDIMAGWSATDSEFTTICRFCESKFIPTLHVRLNLYWVKESIEESGASSPKKLITFSLDNQHSSTTAAAVQYLSPLVLRKELENYLDHEGDMSLSTTNPGFVDEHPIIFWNLIYYFCRLNVPSHLPKLLPKCNLVLKCTNGELGSCPTVVRAVWDNLEIRGTMANPLYDMHKNPAERRSSTIDALITENKTLNQSDIRQLLNHIECNDMLTPIRTMLHLRRFDTKHRQKHSIYRDLLFLAFTEFGRNALDHDAFDREYKLAFRRIPQSDRALITPCDYPPTPMVMWCRKLFSHLQVN